MAELRIVASIEVKNSHKEAVINAFHKVVDGTRKETGCISYDLFEDLENSLKFTILEVWKSQEAIDEHNNSSHFKAFVEAIDGKVESLTVNVLKKVY